AKWWPLSAPIVISIPIGEALSTIFTFSRRFVVKALVNCYFVPSSANLQKKIPAQGCICGNLKQTYLACAFTSDSEVESSGRIVLGFRLQVEKPFCGYTGRPSRILVRTSSPKRRQRPKPALMTRDPPPDLACSLSFWLITGFSAHGPA